MADGTVDRDANDPLVSPVDDLSEENESCHFPDSLFDADAQFGDEVFELPPVKPLFVPKKVADKTPGFVF